MRQRAAAQVGLMVRRVKRLNPTAKTVTAFTSRRTADHIITVRPASPGGLRGPPAQLPCKAPYKRRTFKGSRECWRASWP